MSAYLAPMPDVTRRTALQAAACLAATAVLPDTVLAQAEAPALADRPLFGASLRTLPNGLMVAHVEMRRAPVVAHYAFVRVGAGEDPAGRSGLAHFLEHMMFKGSPRVASGEFSRRVAREGGQDNAFTSRDLTGYYQHVEASRLPLVAMMEADRFRAAALPEDELAAELQVVLEERRLRTDSNPRALFGEALDAAMWGRQHWRGRPIIGWEEEIRNLGHGNLTAFYGQHYGAANTILVVTGAVTEEELMRVVEAEWANVPARSAAPRRRAPPPPAPVEPRLVRHDPRLRGDGVFSRAWQAPTSTAGDTSMGEPLEVLRHILGGGTGSRLHRALVESSIAVSAGAGYDSETLGWTEFDISATPRRETPPARVEEAMIAEVKRLLDAGGPKEEEVARSIRQITAGALLALDSLGAAPRMIGGALAIGLPLAAVEFWPRRLRAVTRDQVAAAAEAVLGRAPTSSGWLLPAGTEAPAEVRL